MSPPSDALPGGAREPPRLPCPFCGNPVVNLSPRYAGPVVCSRVRGRTRRDLGRLVAYEAGCGRCWATLRRPAVPGATASSVRRAALAAWNTRTPDTSGPNPAGFRPCPLCGSVTVEEIAAAPQPHAHHAFFASGVACRGCGLALIPGAGSFGVNATRTAAELRALWARRL